MVIYSNNFHQKLQGVAISKDYLKLNTPFCDIVDDPDYKLDFDLAISYNSAINGNLSAADSFIKNLTLNSGILDWSTLNFYIKKTTSNPIFASSIRGIQSRFNTPAMYSDSYQQSLNEQLNDCLNSPCNLFTQTSDSVGRMAQAASTKSGGNTFGVGTMSATFINMVEELDQTIFNKIPSIFQDAFVETVQVAEKSWTNVQAIFAGKKNISELNRLAQAGQSFRNTDKVYRYTPDVKSYYDYSASGSMILNKIKERLGGCFDKYQYSYRYNPYVDNGEFPSGESSISVNGRLVEVDGAGKIARTTNNNTNFKRTTGNKTDLGARSAMSKYGRSYTDEKGNNISSIYSIGPKGGGNVSNYSVFGALIDTDLETIFYETFDETKNDRNTLMGLGSIGKTYRICPSYFEPTEFTLEKVINGVAVKTTDTTVDGVYARGFRHQLDDEGMETLFNTPQDKVLNDGVAISKGLFKDLISDPGLNVDPGEYKKRQLANEFFVAVRKPNEKWYYYKVIDRNWQENVNLDFTVGALKHFGKANGLPALKASSNAEAIGNTGWVTDKKESHPDMKTLEIRVCLGDLDVIKSEIDKLNDIQAGNTRTTDAKVAEETDDITDEIAAGLAKVEKLQRSMETYGYNDAELSRWLANASPAEKRIEANKLADVLDAQAEVLELKAQESYNIAMG